MHRPGMVAKMTAQCYAADVAILTGWYLSGRCLTIPLGEEGTMNPTVAQGRYLLPLAESILAGLDDF